MYASEREEMRSFAWASCSPMARAARTCLRDLVRIHRTLVAHGMSDLEFEASRAEVHLEFDERRDVESPSTRSLCRWLETCAERDLHPIDLALWDTS